MFELQQVKDIHKPDDYIPITIERIKNKNNNEYLDKFIIHVNSDSFGLFSEKYTFCSTKELVQKFLDDTKKVENIQYSNGYLTCYIIDKNDTASFFNLDETMKNVLKMLNIGRDLNFIDSKCKAGIFVTNNYAGTSKLQIGQFIVIKYDTKKQYVRLTLFSDKNIHIPTLIENMKKVTKYITHADIIQQIQNIPLDEFVKSIKNILPKKVEKEFNEIKLKFNDFNTLHALTYFSYVLNTEKQLQLTKSIFKLLNKK